MATVNQISPFWKKGNILLTEQKNLKEGSKTNGQLIKFLLFD